MEQLNQLLKKQAVLAVSEPSEIITAEELKEAKEILTEQEIYVAIQMALREARLTKRAKIKMDEHNKRIAEGEIKPKVSAEQFYSWILNKAKSEVNNFSLTEGEVKIYKLLSMYFTEDPAFEKDGRSLSKGIMLYGGVGCGKTTIMKLFRDNPSQKFGIVETMVIADLYKDKEEGGSMVTHKYSNVPSICFNDLGTEIESGTSSHFGNKKNVMAEIILNHYERNEAKMFKMHFTTNLNAEEQDRFYGARVRSRLREMCNIFSLEGINDKRK